MGENSDKYRVLSTKFLVWKGKAKKSSIIAKRNNSYAVKLYKRQQL